VDGPPVTAMDLPLPIAFAIQQSIATVLRLDPHTKQSLSSIDGKVIRVEVSSPVLVFHLIVVDNRVDVEGSFDAVPDTTISGSANDLLSLRSKNDALYTGAVKISGDMAVGEQLRLIIANIDIDFEDVIAPLTGDTIAHQAGRVGSSLGAWFSETGVALKRNTSEYLQEEAEFLAPNSEVNRFCSEVDELREKADRLDARVHILEKNQSST